VIEGVFQDNAPHITLTLTGESDSTEVDFVIDTGYTGFLSLPKTTLRSLGAIEEGVSYLVLADGTYRRCLLYTVSVEWGESEREVQVAALDDDPLLGIGLMQEFHLHIEVTEGGSVVLEAL